MDAHARCRRVIQNEMVLEMPEPTMDNLTDFAIERLCDQIGSDLANMSMFAKRRILSLLIPALDEPHGWEIDWRTLVDLSDGDWEIGETVYSHPKKANCFYIPQYNQYYEMNDAAVISAWCREQFENDAWTHQITSLKKEGISAWTFADPGHAAIFKLKWC